MSFSGRFRRHWPWLVVFVMALGGGYALKTLRSGVHPLTYTVDDLGTLVNGQAFTQGLSGTDTLQWDFYLPAIANGIISVGINNQGSDPHFIPESWVYNPSWGSIGDCNSSPACMLYNHYSSATAGTYHIWVYNYVRSSYPMESGSFTMKFILANQPLAVTDGTGGSMYPGITYYNYIVGGNSNYWSFYATKSTVNSVTVTMSNYKGVSGLTAWFWVFAPDGTYLGGGDSATTATLAFKPGQTGTFKIITFNYPAAPNLSAYPYSLKVTGLPVGLPTDAEADGGPCCSCPDGKPRALMPVKVSGTSVADSSTGKAFVADPINCATGNLFEHYVDYTTAGKNPLSFERYYNSLSVSRNLPGTALGPNWRSNYDRTLYLVSGSQTVAQRPDGQAINFASSGSWAPVDADMDYTLTNSGTTWTLTGPDDTSEIYYTSGSSAALQSITKRGGYTQAISYNSSGQISYVSDSYGRQLGLSYSSAGYLTGVTTPDSLSLTYGYLAYSSASVLQSVSYNTSPATSQTYLYENSAFPYALTGITDENGDRYATWTYNGSGQALSSQLGGSLADNLTQISYVSTGNVVTGPLGIQETYKFTTLQNVPKVSEIDRAANGTVAAASETFVYDSNGYLANVADWNGNNTSYVNNSHGLPTQIVYASASSDSETVNITYDGTWVHLPATINSQGLNTSYSYDGSGNLSYISATDMTTTSVPYSTGGTTRKWNYTWTGTGQLLTAQLPRTDVTAKTTYGYTGGTLTSITDAAGHTTSVTSYQSGGRPLTVEDPNGVETDYAWTTREWPSSSTLYTSAGNLVTSYDYDSAGNLTKTTLPDGSYISTVFNAAHWPTSVTNALSENRQITYDSAGDVTNELWKTAGGTTTRQHSATFDALGRMLTDVGGVSQTTSYTYDNNGNTQTITDALGNISYQSVDSLNRLIRTEDPQLAISTISYDSRSRPLTVTDPKGNATTYVYNGFGNRIQQASPDSGTTVYYYDPDSNVTETLDAASAETDMTYDSLDRQLTRTYPADSSLNVAIYYDSSGHGYGVGHMTGASDAVGTLSQSWNQQGLMSSATRTISGNDYTSTYTYESAGRLSSITYASSGWRIGYGRDAAGQISYVSSTQPSHSATNLAAGVTHEPFGPVTGWTYGNGITDTRTYDADYRMTSVKDANGASNIQYLSYGYDADNNVTSITDNVTPANNQTLTYDSDSRIGYASGPYGTVSSITYDSNSNRLTYGATSYTVPGTSNKMSVAGGSSIAYTSTGNVSGIGTDSMTYNKANQMATATVSGTTSTYTYDVFGIREKVKTGSNPTQIMQYDQDDNLTTETDTSGTETDYAYMDDVPVAAIQPGAATISSLLTDHMGTPQIGTNSSKATVWTGVYDPNGKVSVTGSLVQNLRFAGQRADSTGYNYNIYRFYNPTYAIGGGRYLQYDLLGLGAGPNPYVYVGNNPYKWLDPWGLARCTYYISKHTLVCFPNDSNLIGPPVVLGPTDVFSGSSECRNNTSQQCLSSNSKGAITPGNYLMNKDNRQEHAGEDFWRLEPDPKIPGWMCDLGLARCGFELHKGHFSLGCITAYKESEGATTQYNAVNTLLNKENGDNHLTVVP